MSDRNGFTLIELLVVISIIAILASILLPAVTSAIFQANVTKCSAQLDQLGKSLRTYNTSFHRYPPLDGGSISSNWGRYLQKVTIDGEKWDSDLANELYFCPVLGAPPTDSGSDYYWANKGSGCFQRGQLTDSLDTETPIAADAWDASNGGNHGGKSKPHNVLIFGGSVQQVHGGSRHWERAYHEKCVSDR